MNRFDVAGVIGEGTYGIVLKAKYKEIEEFVAIKKFKETIENESVKKTSFRELKILKSLKHPNIIELKDSFQFKNKLHMVFEFVEYNLLEIIEHYPQGIDLDLSRYFTFQLIKALDYCHLHGIIHRDIKPENLLVSPNYVLKLCDFGFARPLLRMGAEYTEYVATRWYRAPEILLGIRTYNQSADIWSVACILSEMIEGKPLFPGDTDVDQLFLIQKLVGPLIGPHLESFSKNPRFYGFKFYTGEQLDDNGIEQKSDSHAEALRFIKFILQMDPSKRPTGRQCISNIYFNKIHQFDPNKIKTPISHIERKLKAYNEETETAANDALMQPKPRPFMRGSSFEDDSSPILNPIRVLIPAPDPNITTPIIPALPRKIHMNFQNGGGMIGIESPEEISVLPEFDAEPKASQEPTRQKAKSIITNFELPIIPPSEKSSHRDAFRPREPHHLHHHNHHHHTHHTHQNQTQTNQSFFSYNAPPSREGTLDSSSNVSYTLNASVDELLSEGTQLGYSSDEHTTGRDSKPIRRAEERGKTRSNRSSICCPVISPSVTYSQASIPAYTNTTGSNLSHPSRSPLSTYLTFTQESPKKANQVKPIAQIPKHKSSFSRAFPEPTQNETLTVGDIKALRNHKTHQVIHGHPTNLASVLRKKKHPNHTEPPEHVGGFRPLTRNRVQLKVEGWPKPDPPFTKYSVPNAGSTVGIPRPSSRSETPVEQRTIISVEESADSVNMAATNRESHM